MGCGDAYAYVRLTDNEINDYLLKKKFEKNVINVQTNDWGWAKKIKIKKLDGYHITDYDYENKYKLPFIKII